MLIRTDPVRADPVPDHPQILGSFCCSACRPPERSARRCRHSPCCYGRADRSTRAASHTRARTHTNIRIHTERARGYRLSAADGLVTQSPGKPGYLPDRTRPADLPTVRFPSCSSWLRCPPRAPPPRPPPSQ